MVDLDRLYAKGLSASEVSNAVSTQNVILPAGTAKMGPTEYVVRTNSSPDVFATLNDVPVRQDGAATVRTSFTTMAYGMLLAIVLVYLLMAVNFQSWVPSDQPAPVSAGSSR